MENVIDSDARKNVDGNVGSPRRIDNTAQSMSSRSSALRHCVTSSGALLGVIVLSVLS